MVKKSLYEIMPKLGRRALRGKDGTDFAYSIPESRVFASM
jgi:hypothetical protein